MINVQVKNWLSNETRMRPAKFEKDLREYMDHQDKLRELTRENVIDFPDGIPSGRAR